MTPVISESLQKTVRLNPNLTEVFFDEAGRHYFNVHKLRSDKDDKDEKNWKEYGSGIPSHRQRIPGSELWGIRGDNGVSELIAKGNPDTEIVVTLSRKEILEAKAKPEGKSLLAQIANATPEERKAIKEVLKDESDNKDFDLDV